MSKLFQDILKRGRAQGVGRPNEQEAIDWFRSAALRVSRANPRDAMEQAGPFQRMQSLSVNSIGKMYLFSYDPKWKEELPYYDRFPLIFPIEFYGDSMLGINLHYLPPATRATLMDALYESVMINKDTLNKTTKLKISYQILKGAARFGAFKPCVKKYLFNHVVSSQFMYVSPEEWPIALMLPMDRFAKANKLRVWADSLRMIRG